jgi:hypothetical protein
MTESEKTEKKRKFFSVTPYIDSEDRKNNLITHQYQAEDKSITYQYIMNPLAKKLTEKFVSPNVAPNTLTLISFMHTVVPLVLTYSIEGPDLTAPFPRWLCFVYAYCLMVYRVLDEMDGK